MKKTEIDPDEVTIYLEEVSAVQGSIRRRVHGRHPGCRGWRLQLALRVSRGE